MGKWNGEAAPNNNIASEELTASELVYNERQVNDGKNLDEAAAEEAKKGSRK
ncbi:hypothetical protein [Cytobacillus sp. NCCP-133]|uniref:hypothetical protein n=1 Tax=Cytobacillus sp. NCCP-133 TaxID=766848 RepID=UPI0022317928|nr:hypothetical protein [Cytobacillus sp. NCCP-133]GLB58312.1 hypothetical protein NCCP133_04450 [Cytobacillus sp. NCCP-133]